MSKPLQSNCKMSTFPPPSILEMEGVVRFKSPVTNSFTYVPALVHKNKWNQCSLMNTALIFVTILSLAVLVLLRRVKRMSGLVVALILSS